MPKKKSLRLLRLYIHLDPEESWELEKKLGKILKPYDPNHQIRLNHRSVTTNDKNEIISMPYIRPKLAPEWDPIQTAPKDGTHILLFTKGYTKRWIGWFYNNAWHWDGVYEGVFPSPPTHWQPLPDPPDKYEEAK